MRFIVGFDHPVTCQRESVIVLVKGLKPHIQDEEEQPVENGTAKAESSSYTVAQLMADASRRLSAASGEKVELIKLVLQSSGATLLPEDEVVDYVQDGEMLTGLTTESKHKEEEKGKEAETEEEEVLKGFSLIKKMVKVCDEYEEHTFIVIEDHELRNAINQYASDEAFYEERPQVDPETLLVCPPSPQRVRFLSLL
jgi:hypothetical protein